MALVLQLTNAGLAAVTAAAGTAQTVIAELGLTSQPFVAAPTLTALPGEFKRLEILSGTAAAPNVVHVTAYDTSAEVWSANGFGLYLEDGTLFGTYGSNETVLSKAGLAFALMAFDIAINADLAALITFGNAEFVWPPATEERRGIAQLATQAEVDAGLDDQKIVTPSRLKTLMNALYTTLMTAINVVSTAAGTAQAGVNSLRALQFTGGGLVSGGGDLSANRVLTVSEASAAEVTAGTATDKVITPRRLGPISMTLAQNGYLRFFGFQLAWGRFSAAANATTAVDFVQAFPTACFSAVVSGVTNTGTGSQDNTPAVLVSTITRTGFSVFNADDEADATCYIAVGY